MSTFYGIWCEMFPPCHTCSYSFSLPPSLSLYIYIYYKYIYRGETLWSSHRWVITGTALGARHRVKTIWYGRNGSVLLHVLFSKSPIVWLMKTYLIICGFRNVLSNFVKKLCMLIRRTKLCNVWVVCWNQNSCVSRNYLSEKYSQYWITLER